MIVKAWNRMRGAGPQSHQYASLPLWAEKEPLLAEKESLLYPTRVHQHAPPRWTLSARAAQALAIVVGVYAMAVFVYSYVLTTDACDTIDQGYICHPQTTHFLGQYSPWYAVPSDIDLAPPEGCQVTLANVLSRHGGRDPTLGKSVAYHLLIAEIQQTSTAYPGEFSFLKDYNYTLGADQLTHAGRREMFLSGAHFYRRYRTLVSNNPPFVRSGGQERVVESAEKWLEGVASLQAKKKPGKINLIIPEGPGSNNTLSHDTCNAFEHGPSHSIGGRAMRTWASKFVPPIQERINAALGTKLGQNSIIHLMDMCPFDTMADPHARMSDFCRLFSEKEWQAYDYLQTLGKYYGYGAGNPLGPTQGVGYVNELLARLTGLPVDDHTNTNRTLDSDAATFPLDRRVYADFSHDNDISGVLAALGLYNKTRPLSDTTRESTAETFGYSAAWTVPFAARLYVEKLACIHEGEYVRIIVNDRVHPLEFCGGDKYGRCSLSRFVKSQSFARSGGLWDQCYA